MSWFAENHRNRADINQGSIDLLCWGTQPNGRMSSVCVCRNTGRNIKRRCCWVLWPAGSWKSKMWASESGSSALQVAAVPDAMQFSTRYGVLLWLPQNPSARSFSLRFCFQTYLARCTLKIHNAKVSGECPKGVGIWWPEWWGRYCFFFQLILEHGAFPSVFQKRTDTFSSVLWRWVCEISYELFQHVFLFVSYFWI